MENDRKHSLGNRAFFIFLFRRIKFAVFLFILSGAVWYSERWMSPELLVYGEYVVKLMFLLSATYLLLVILWTFLEYHYYTYTFTDEAFIMTSGYVMRSEMAALYHQIQNVNIRRGPLDRMIGVSQIVIFLVGAEKEAGHNQIVLPAVGRKKAKLVQKELLIRARRHVVPAEVPSETPMA